MTNKCPESNKTLVETFNSEEWKVDNDGNIYFKCPLCLAVRKGIVSKRSIGKKGAGQYKNSLIMPAHEQVKRPFNKNISRFEKIGDDWKYVDITPKAIQLQLQLDE